jgi:hypothetical protein
MTYLRVDSEFFHRVQKDFIDPVASMPTRTGSESVE